MEKDIALKPAEGITNRAIQNKLIGAFIITTFVISSLYGMLVYNGMKYTEDDILNRRLILESEYFFEQYARDKSTAQLPKSKGLVSYLSSSENLPNWLAVQPVGTRELHDIEVHIGVIEIPNSEERLYLSLSETESSSLENDLSTLFMVLLFVGALITTLGLIIGLLFSRAISNPIVLLKKDVEDLKRNSKQSFYGGDRGDEVGALSRSFTQLVSRLQGFLEREKQFTKYASHELRTPISLIKNALAVLRLPSQDQRSQDRNLGRIEAATVELESLVSTFLTLGREDHSTEKYSIDLLDVLKKNINRNNIVAQYKRFDIDIEVVNSPKPFIANKALVDILIDNIIRNIHTHGGTRATIKVDYDSLIFENDIMLNKTTLNHEIKQSYGMEIVSKIAQRSDIQISSKIGSDGYMTILTLP
jgi:signal transduction histidine kinase